MRFHPACWHAPTARRRPALVALVEGAAGAFAVHRTYLTAQGRKLEPAEDAKLSLGAAGRIDPAARLWAALSAPGLAGLVLPPRPGRLVVAADGDAAGRQAAEALAERARAAGWDVALAPAPEGRDWNDVLREARDGTTPPRRAAPLAPPPREKDPTP